MSEAEYTVLQRIGTEMAKKGFLKPDPWVEENCRQAQRLFMNHLCTAAVIMAAADKFALDYIKQAPVIVVAACRGHDTALEIVRDEVMENASTIFVGGPKLRDVMGTFGLAVPLRKLTPAAFSMPGVNLWKAVKDVSKVDNSTLAQSIPDCSGGQGDWLGSIMFWGDTFDRRNMSRLTLLEWFLLATRKEPELARVIALEIADYVAANMHDFNEAWSLRRAAEEAAKWHAALAKMNHSERFKAETGYDFEQEMDYGELPNELLVGDFKFKALKSALAIYEEGAAMHHCVGSYASHVASKKCWIYSVQKDGQRIATLEVVRNGDSYVNRQLQGVCNSASGPLPEVVRSAADFFVNCLIKKKKNDSTGKNTRAA